MEVRWAENHKQHVDFVRGRDGSYINLLTRPGAPYDGEGEFTDPCYCFKKMPYDSSWDRLYVMCSIWRRLVQLPKPWGNTQRPPLARDQGMGCAPSPGARRPSAATTLLPPSLAHQVSTWRILAPFKYLLSQLYYHHLSNIGHFDYFYFSGHFSHVSFVQFSTYIQANILQIFICTSLNIFLYNMNALRLFVYFHLFLSWQYFYTAFINC